MSPDGDDQRRMEAELLSRVAEGDEGAFAELYDRFSPGLYSMALRIVGGSQEAEDVLQEAFHQIWRRATTYEPGRSSAFTWAVMILRNKAIDRLRARRRLSRTLEKAADLNYFSDIDDASAALPLRNEKEARVRSALASIPEDQKQAIGMAFFGGLTHEEIAERLSEPLGTIKARIRRGLLRLRDRLKEKA
jgi:RNA polymerase sigma-70 factor, ECF subfamily